MPARQDHRLARTGEHWLSLPNPHGVPAEICAGGDVPLEPAAVDEALSLLDTAATLERLAEAVPHYAGPAPRITRLVLTPDFHKGAGIPIGTVLETENALLPQAVGNDVNCGMRLEVTTLRADRVRPRLDALERRLRHLFFEGGRRIALTPAQREGLLRDGLPGLLLTGDAPRQGVRPDDAGDRVVHRKGATPAGGHAETAGGPYAMWGEPVIVPGSMGAASFVLRGHGSPRTLSSACHGAGRRVPRGAAARGNDAELDAFLRDFRVVTPLDHRDPGVARRPDVIDAWRRDLKQEAPWAYKDIGPVVAGLHGGGVASPVAELRPLLTVKG
ncbi:RtcB family protein [Actinomadura sp. 9N215]|uniref:RtcB family protein n=1 Tax=Actinomadura sp. 9N215 TaxID=3375150 RepID=UPI00378F62C7